MRWPFGYCGNILSQSPLTLSIAPQAASIESADDGAVLLGLRMFP
jgi:hypothetical protein